MKRHGQKPDPENFKIVSGNCISIGNGSYLCKADRGNEVVMLYVCQEGLNTAAIITTEKMADSSMEHILSLFSDDYYSDRLCSAIERYLK